MLKSLKKKILIALAHCALLTTFANCKEPQQMIEAKKPDAKIESQCYSTLLSKRFSGRSFDPARAVSLEQIKQLIEAARLAPSSYNEQPWKFIVCDRNTNPDAYKKAFSALVEFNQGWAKTAPLLILSIANTKSGHNGSINHWSQYDTGAATFSIMLEATDLGLMAHQMGGFDAAKIKELFSLPEEWVPMAVMAVGYPSPNEVAPERTRKPIDEIFFMGSLKPMTL